MTADPMAAIQPFRPAERGAGSASTDARKPNGPDQLSPRATDLLSKATPAADFTPNLDRHYLVKGWLNAGAMSVVYGEPSTGKTFLAIDISAHVAGGQQWAGCRVTGGPVLYVAAEGGHGFGNRVAAIEGRDGLPLWALPVTVDLCRADPDTAALIEMVRHLAELHGPYALIVVDTLARSMGSGDENASPDMGSLVRNLDRLRAATGAHVMVIHHTGKDGTKGARGHSSLRAATDTEIELSRVGDVIVAEARKQRDMPAGRTFSYRLREIELGRDHDFDPVTTCRVEPCETPDRAPPLPGSAQIALQALDDALAQHGVTRKQDGVPSCRVVALEKWREMAEAHGLSDSDDRDSRKRAFNRAAKTLRERGYLRQYNDLVWRCPR